ncbi:hypothetical protein F7725_003557 [Dissostichus mawsoni]|uniref:Uncharacterized protein n=1 Tax=Dissostichus mawsoni TaxID=36200 RepID=A0A7J5YCI9_DISMA|nr:hypothetical protein F7725_003557 [Dissostichus mawsoni]
MRKVTQKHKHQVNMHHVQKDSALFPTEATRLKEIQVRISSSIRTMPTGTVSVLKSSVTMASQLIRTLSLFMRFFLPHSVPNSSSREAA